MVVGGFSFDGIGGDASFERVIGAVGVPGSFLDQVSLGVSSGILVCTVNDEVGRPFGGAVVAIGV